MNFVWTLYLKPIESDLSKLIFDGLLDTDPDSFLSGTTGSTFIYSGGSGVTGSSFFSSSFFSTFFYSGFS